MIWYKHSLPLHSVNACSIEVMLVVNQKMNHTVSDTRHFPQEERWILMKNLDNDGTKCKKRLWEDGRITAHHYIFPLRAWDICNLLIRQQYNSFEWDVHIKKKDFSYPSSGKSMKNLDNDGTECKKRLWEDGRITAHHYIFPLRAWDICNIEING